MGSHGMTWHSSELACTLANIQMSHVIDRMLRTVTTLHHTLQYVSTTTMNKPLAWSPTSHNRTNGLWWPLIHLPVVHAGQTGFEMHDHILNHGYVFFCFCTLFFIYYLFIYSWIMGGTTTTMTTSGHQHNNYVKWAHFELQVM